MFMFVLYFLHLEYSLCEKKVPFVVDSDLVAAESFIRDTEY